MLESQLEKLANQIGRFGLAAAAVTFLATAGQFSWRTLYVEGQSWNWAFLSTYLKFAITAITILVRFKPWRQLRSIERACLGLSTVRCCFSPVRGGAVLGLGLPVDLPEVCKHSHHDTGAFAPPCGTPATCRLCERCSVSPVCGAALGLRLPVHLPKSRFHSQCSCWY